MTAPGRTALALCLIGLVPILMIPAFISGVWVGLLALILPLAVAVAITLRPRQK